MFGGVWDWVLECVVVRIESVIVIVIRSRRWWWLLLLVVMVLVNFGILGN